MENYEQKSLRDSEMKLLLKEVLKHPNGCDFFYQIWPKKRQSEYEIAI
jgi:hypothetical protein